MKIESVEAIPFSIPLTAPTGFAHASISSADHVLVRLRTDDGIVGQAEAPARPFTYGESQVSIVNAVTDWFAPVLVGLDPFAREVVHEQMSWLVHNHTARGAIDMAMWDIIGQAVGQPCHRLLGGYSDSMRVCHILFASSPEAMVDEALAMRERYGFDTFKIKVGTSPKKDVEACRGLRSALGDDTELYVDANKGWSCDEAIRLLPVMEETGVTMLEEPTAAFEPLARRRLAAKTNVPILADESVTRLSEVAREAIDGQTHLISLKTARTGFTESHRIIGLCEGLGVGIAIGSQMDSMIGTLGSLAVGAAFPSTCRRAAELDYFLILTDDLLAEPLEIADGRLAVREQPGVGIEIDEEKLSYYRVDRDSQPRLR